LKTLKISESKRIEATWDNAKKRVGTEAKIAMIAHWGHLKDSLPSTSTHQYSRTIQRAAQQRLGENDAEPV
jgi:3-phosphoglycerate kinase